MITPIATPRLALEPTREGDLADLSALNVDPEVRRFIGGVRSAEESAAELGRILAAEREHGCGGWMIRTRDDRSFVGRVGIKRAATTGEHELLYAIRRSCWGHGYATEAAAAVLARTFASGITRVIACASPKNLASIAVMKKLGMTFDRRARMYDDGDDEDEVVYVAERR